MSMARYNAIDLSRSSPAANLLFARLEHEATQAAFSITPVYNENGVPPFLTNAMTNWYQSLHPIRNRALEEVASEFKNNDCFIFEAERDRIEQRKFEASAAERKTFQQIKLARDTYDDLRTKSAEYQALKDANGRDAIKQTPILYWVVLFAFVVPEFMINWNSFLKIPLIQNIPAFALGTLMIVAVAFAFSSHFVGLSIKQRNDRFGGNVSEGDRRRNRWELIIGLTLFVFAMAIVFWGRYLLIADLVQENTILRGQGFELSDLVQHGGALLGNLVVWVLGVTWSMWNHDSVQGFSELRREVEDLRLQLRSLVDRYLSKRNQRHELAAFRELERLRRSEKAQAANTVGYHQARELFAQLRQKDEEALALLAEYKNDLIEKIRTANRSTLFVTDDVTKADVDTSVRFTIDQFASLPINFRYD